MTLCKRLVAMSMVSFATISFADNTVYYTPQFRSQVAQSNQLNQAAPTKAYFGINLGILKIETINAELNSLQNKYPVTYSMNGGFRMSRHTAFELGYAYATVKAKDVSEKAGNEQATFSYPYIAAKIMLPLAPQFDIYTKLGLSYVTVTSKTDPSGNLNGEPIPYLGLGADFNLGRHFAINLDASGPSFGVIGFYDLSAGIALKF